MLEKEELEVEEIVFLRCSGVKGKVRNPSSRESKGFLKKV
jgi:hypothetical protein